MAAEVHYFGIRHHGPGSARRLLEALDALAPAEVLVEGPQDLSELLPMLAAETMTPPVALLAYPADAPEEASFWPFAEYSPEYQAVRWAVRAGVPVRFIDLASWWPRRDVQNADDAAEDPAAAAAPDAGSASSDEAGTAAQNAEPVDTAEEAAVSSEATAAAPGAEGGSAGDDAEGAATDADQEERSAETAATARSDDPEHDPIGTLARAAGYEDGESWWRDVIEENPDSGPVFAAVADAMGELREGRPPSGPREAAREACMRLEIAKSRRDADGPVAVVCGAWHVPALRAKHTAKDDRALLKGAKKRKMVATWAPWTAPRLAYASGYGAGVQAPGWCAHLWATDADDVAIRWVGRIASALREAGHLVSTASLIETQRLGVALAALRDRPRPGFEELREAAVACLCEGNELRWSAIAEAMLIGSEVGVIPDDVPLAPLLQDLQRQQKALRLKPEALERELSLDLRTDTGLARSVLLHRLTVLDVPWGTPTDSGSSRGTFRERWVIAWDPEYAVRLIEQLVFGPTIERAANGRMAQRLREASDLGDLAGLVLDAMTAQLDDAAETGIDALGRRAAQTSDCAELLAAIPPMVDVIRYGEARQRGTENFQDLLHRIVVQATLALPYAVQGLDDDGAEALRGHTQRCDAAIRLAELDADDVERWTDALRQIERDDRAAPLVAGVAARLLYEAEAQDPEETVLLLRRRLSPGATVAAAAGYFAGFFEGAGHRLIHDAALRGCVDAWVTDLDGDAFVEYLPLFRRVFSVLDASERRHLLDALFGRGRQALPGRRALDLDAVRWSEHLQRIGEIMEAGADGGA